jgi:hypothetical protein
MLSLASLASLRSRFCFFICFFVSFSAGDGEMADVLCGAGVDVDVAVGAGDVGELMGAVPRG